MLNKLHIRSIKRILETNDHNVVTIRVTLVSVTNLIKEKQLLCLVKELNNIFKIWNFKNSLHIYNILCKPKWDLKAFYTQKSKSLYVY